MQDNLSHVNENDLTFFVWADPHFGYEPQFGADDIRWQALQQMNALPGWPYPPEIGGAVGAPAFILLCGDFVDGGVNDDGGQDLAYYLHCMKQTNLRSFETLGNHDTGYPKVLEYFVQKHGGRYYSFDKSGIHFISFYQVFGKDEKVKALDNKQLQWLAQDLSGIGPDKPVVLFSHDRLDNLPNADMVHSILSKTKVILMLSGHTHLQKDTGGFSYKWNDRHGIVIGHCRNHPIDPDYGRIFLAVTVQPTRVIVAPWRWDLRTWAGGEGCIAGQPEYIIVPRR